jgi:hypothetical protein
MRDYSPKRRTAVVFTGSGASGAYHAGVLRALDESGVKIDLVVGSGIGTLAAVFAAVAGGARLYGAEGFWKGLGWRSLYRVRPILRATLWLLAAIVGVIVVPAALALVLGLLSPLILLVWLLVSHFGGGVPGWVGLDLGSMPTLYSAALALPAFGLALAVGVFVARLFLRDRKRMGEAFEAVLDERPAEERLRVALWAVARGPAVSADAPSAEELSKRYAALLAENLGQPGFRELILRAADLETGSAFPFVLLEDVHRAAFAAARSRGVRLRGDGIPGAVDLRRAGYEGLLFDAAMTGLLPLLGAPVRRIAFPRGGVHAGEVHRLADAALVGGSGLSEALAAGAQQVIVVTGVPEEPHVPPRRRGPRALADGLLAALERRAVDHDVEGAERLNRMVETLGHRSDDGGRGWQDPATGRLYRDVGLYVIRPERRTLGPLELDGAPDPASEVIETLDDLAERGYHDAYRLFVEPVVGGGEPASRPDLEHAAGQVVEL